MPEDILSAQTIQDGLNTRFIGQRVLYFPRLTSTMEVAREEAHRGAAGGTVILADVQTAGRGRLQRAWLSPQGNIAVSVILRSNLTDLPALIRLASLSVVSSIEDLTGLKPQIKWPNDVLINGKKVCGILIENDFLGSKLNASIIGIGINVNLRLAELPEIREIATSLSDELGKEVSRLKLIRRLLVEMEIYYLRLSTGDSLFEDWRAKLVTLGKQVKTTTGDGIYEGTAESVDTDGSLLLRLSEGSLIRIVAGDVTLR